MRSTGEIRFDEFFDALEELTELECDSAEESIDPSKSVESLGFDIFEGRVDGGFVGGGRLLIDESGPHYLFEVFKNGPPVI